MACIDADDHAISQAVVDKQLHCFSPPATSSNLAILQDDAEAHKLLQLAYSGLIGFLWGGDLHSIEDETIHWRVLSIVKAVVETAGHFLMLMPAQLPKAWHGFLQKKQCALLATTRSARHQTRSVLDARACAAAKNDTEPHKHRAAGAACDIAARQHLSSLAGLYAALLCTVHAQTPVVCDGADMNSSADKSLPATELALQHLAQQWLQYLASEDAFLHLVEHKHDGHRLCTQTAAATPASTSRRASSFGTWAFCNFSPQPRRTRTTSAACWRMEQHSHFHSTISSIWWKYGQHGPHATM